MAKKRKIVKKTKEAKPKLSKKQIKKPLKKLAKSKAKKNTSSLKKVRIAVHSPGLPKQVRPKRVKAEPKKITVAYNESELAKYKEYKKELEKSSIDQLKNILKANGQTCTGTKDVLIEKVADGKVLGKIPRCTKCFGGRLRFDFKTGKYTCPGYRDDTDFHFCNKKYEFNEITRDAWIDA